MFLSQQKVGRGKKRIGKMMISMTVMMIHFSTELGILRRKENRGWRKQER